LISQRYTNFFPTANFNYTPVKGKRLRFRYNGRTNQPDISQLQNVVDATDTLHIRTGNPELKQEFNHNLALNYNSFNNLTFRLLAVNLNFSTTQNKIVNSISNAGPGMLLTRPENVNGYFRASSFITVGLPFKDPELKGSSLNFTNNLSYTRDISLLNDGRNTGKTFIASQSAGVNINKEKFDVGVRLKLAYTRVNYSINKMLNEDFFAHTYSCDFSYNFPKNIILFTDFDYYINTGRAEGYNLNIPLWNASLRKQVFSKKNGEIRLSVNDILNQNQSVTRNANDNYIQDTRSMVLRRYFIVSFLYNLNRTGGKGRQSQPGMQRRTERSMEEIQDKQ